MPGRQAAARWLRRVLLCGQMLLGWPIAALAQAQAAAPTPAAVAAPLAPAPAASATPAGSTPLAEPPAPTLTLQQQYQADNPQARALEVNLVSEAYQEDPSNPGLQLLRLWSAEGGTLLELRGLPRRGQQHSAIVYQDTLRLHNLTTSQMTPLLASDGGARFDDRAGRKMLRISPGDTVYLFFGRVEVLQPHALVYTNALGRDDRYFDRIDPLFRQRYNQMHARAERPDASVDELRDFLLGFVGHDPDGRLEKVFVRLIGKLHSLGTFEGHYQAFKLIKDPADERAAARLASTDEQRARLNEAIAEARRIEAEKQEARKRAEEARLAAVRQREEARQADLRRQEELKAAEQRALQARQDEERCLATPTCRQAMEERRAQCIARVRACYGDCDRFTGNGQQSSFIGNLAAAVMARGCYTGCKCETGFGDLLAKVNEMTGDAPPSRAPDRAAERRAAPAAKVYECKIYCQSTSGPTILRRFPGATQRDAAKLADQQADQACAAAGLGKASSRTLSDAQCSEVR